MTQEEKRRLGDYIRAARVAAGLSTHELARLAGINQSYLVKLENNQNDNPAAEKLQRIADVLELDSTELLRFIGVDPSKVAPSVEAVFRKHYGLTDEEAKEAAELIEQRYGKRTQTKGGDNDTHNKRTSNTE